MRTTNAEPSVVIHIVDDDDGARGGLRELLDSHEFTTKSYASGEAFLNQLPIETAGCIVLDIEMPGMSGMELQKVLAQRGCEIPIVFLTAHGTIPNSVTAIKAGAEDFLPKLAEEEELVGAVRRAVQRSMVTLEQQQRNSHVMQCAASLTEREREVCEFLIGGWLNKQIARRLDISDRTVKAHKAKVLEKFAVTSIAELVRVAVDAGIKPVNPTGDTLTAMPFRSARSRQQIAPMDNSNGRRSL